MLFPRSVIFEATLFQQESASLAFQGPFFPSKRTQERWVFMGTKVDQFPRFGGEHSESRQDSKFFLVNSPTTKTPQHHLPMAKKHTTHGTMAESSPAVTGIPMATQRVKEFLNGCVELRGPAKAVDLFALRTQVSKVGGGDSGERWGANDDWWGWSWVRHFFIIKYPPWSLKQRNSGPLKILRIPPKRSRRRLHVSPINRWMVSWSLVPWRYLQFYRFTIRGMSMHGKSYPFFE